MGFELFPAPLVDTLQQFCSNESNGILRPTNRQPVVMVVVQAGSCLMSIQKFKSPTPAISIIISITRKTDGGSGFSMRVRVEWENKNRTKGTLGGGRRRFAKGGRG